MEMTEEHKTALAQGRRESKAIRDYLEALGSRRPGRPVTKKSLTSRLDRVNEKLDTTDNPLDTVELLQTRIDIEKALSEIGSDDMDSLEAGFVEHAKSYSERKGVTYTAWREFGVPAQVLRAAGIKETRRR